MKKTVAFKLEMKNISAVQTVSSISPMKNSEAGRCFARLQEEFEKWVL